MRNKRIRMVLLYSFTERLESVLSESITEACCMICFYCLDDEEVLTFVVEFFSDDRVAESDIFFLESLLVA